MAGYNLVNQHLKSTHTPEYLHTSHSQYTLHSQHSVIYDNQFSDQEQDVFEDCVLQIDDVHTNFYSQVTFFILIIT